MIRNITVWNNSTQERTVFENVDVTTWGDVLPLLEDKGIDVTNMEIREGRSKTAIINEDTVLPTNIPFRGETTNDLLFYMTLTNKKVSSGVGMSRKEMIDYMRENNILDALEDAYGDSYTRISNANMSAFIDKWQNREVKDNPAKDSPINDCPGLHIVAQSVVRLVNALLDEETICEDEAEYILEGYGATKIVEEAKEEKPEIKDNGASMDEIDEMRELFG